MLFSIFRQTIFNNIICSTFRKQYTKKNPDPIIQRIFPVPLLLQSVVMEHMFRRESVSNVRECVTTTHLVISQPERVTMDVVIIGLENFVKVFSFIVSQTTYYIPGIRRSEFKKTNFACICVFIIYIY